MNTDDRKTPVTAVLKAEGTAMTNGHDRKRPNPAIWLGLIGGVLAAFNNVVATLALGVVHGPIVLFTTPLAFAFGRLMFPRLPAASIIYIPLVIVSIFTLNLGPPGAYKILYLAGAIAYDVAGYAVGIGRGNQEKIALWKLFVAAFFYPLGLFLGAIMAVSWFAVEVPLMAKGLAFVPAAIAMMDVFILLATFVGHKIYYSFIASELKS